MCSQGGSTEEEAVENWNNRQGFDNQADIKIVIGKNEYLREIVMEGKKRKLVLDISWEIERILLKLLKRL